MVDYYRSLPDKSLSDAFQADGTGHYRVSRTVSANDIIQAAKILLSQHLQGLVALSDYQEVKDFLLAQLSGHLEILAAVFMDGKSQVITFEKVLTGAIGDNPMYVSRQVAQRALELNAQKVILARNDACGMTGPVQVDKQIAVRVQATLKALEIDLFDFCVISRGRTISLVEWGFLKENSSTN